MKSLVVGIALLACIGRLTAQEPIAQEKAQKAAAMLAAAAKNLKDLPLKSEVDLEKAFGMKGGDVAALVIPEKGLTSGRLDKAGKDIVPVGQIWLKGLTPIVSGNATPNEKLRMVKIKEKNEEHELPLLLLGARLKEKGKLELVVYAKAKEPLLVLPLEAIDTTQEQPIELKGKKGDAESGFILIHILGKHRAELPVGAAKP